MSATVDSRVVEMHFDNSDFMSKIKETIASLETLNDRINALNASKGLDNLANGANGNDLNGVADAVGNIESRFSNLGIVGMTVLQRLTNAGMNMALKVSGGLTKVFSQIKQGGTARAENIEQAKFLLEGLHADVTAIMEDVNYAVEGTAYGLDEAAKASAVFFAAGVEQGDKMKTALRAISGVAAMTGSSYAGMAEVFQDTAGKGAFMTQELRRIQAQGVAADQYLIKFFDDINAGKKTFEEVPKDVQDAVKSITNGTKTTHEELDDLLRDGKISFEVFAAAMDDAFGEHATEANKTFSGSLANMKTALSRLGEAFITPSMKAAVPLFNAIREAISTFATKLKEHMGVVEVFTRKIMGLGLRMGAFIKLLGGLKFTEDELQSLHDHGFLKLAKVAEKSGRSVQLFADIGLTVGNSMKFLGKVFETTGEAFKEVFPEAGVDSVRKAIMWVNAAVSRFLLAHEKLEGFKNVMIGVFSIFKIAGNIFSGVLKVIGSLIKAIFSLTSSASGFSEVLANVLQKMADKSGAINVFDLLAKAATKAGEMIRKAVEYIKKSFEKVFDVFSDGAKNVKSLDDAIGLIGLGFAALFSQKTIRQIMSWSNRFGKTFKECLRFFDLGSTIDENGKKRSFLTTQINDVLGNTTRVLKQMTLEVNTKLLKNIAFAILALAAGLKILSDIDPNKLQMALKAITVLMAELGLMLTLLTKLATAGGLESSIKGLVAIGGLSNTLVKIGVALILVAAAVKMLSTLKPEELAKGLSAITIILGGLLGFMIGISKYTKYMGPKLKGVATTIIGISIAMILLSKAVENLGSMDLVNLGKGLGSVVVLLGTLFGFIIGVSNLAKAGGAGMVAVGAGLVLMASAINILVPAVERIGNLDLSVIGKGLLGVAGALAALALASQFMSVGGAVGILIASAAVLGLANAIKIIGTLDIEQIKNGLIGIAGALAMFMAVGTIIAIFPQIALGLAALSLALLSFGAAVALAGAGLVMIGAGLASISAGIMSFASISQTAILMFTNSIRLVIQSIISLLPTIAATVAESFVVFLENIAELAPRLVDAITEIITCIIEAIENNVPRLVETGLDLLIGLLEGINEAIPKISSLGVSIIAGFIQGIADQLEVVIQAGIDLMLAFINGLAKGVRDNADAVRGAILNLCTALLEAFCAFWGIASPSTVMEEQGVNLILGLINGIKNKVKNVPSVLIDGVSRALGKVRQLPSKFTAAGRNLIQGLANGIKSKASQIVTNIKNAVTRAVTAIKGYVSKFTSAGSNMVKGVANGIRNGVSSVISAVGSIAKRALSHFKSKLGINSPSKEFAKIAVGIPEGIVKGIDKSKKMTIASIGKMSDSMLEEMGKAISETNDLMVADDTFNPTITPVLDLSDVRKGAGQIDSILNDGTVSAAYSAANSSKDFANNQMISLFNKLIDTIDDMNNSDNGNTTNYNNITVSGSENPDDFAGKLLRSLETRVRTA